MRNIRLWTDKSLKKVQAVLMLPQNQLLILGGGGEATHFGLDKMF